MLNHVRTLLMNIEGTQVPYDVPGEELMPENFKPVTLTSALTNARRVLFGATPDRHMLNYRCKQLLGIIHATDLRTFIPHFDKRITYEVRRDSFSSNALFGVKVTKMGNATQPLMVIGKPTTPDASGLMSLVWLVHVVDSDTVDVKLTSPLIGASEQYVIADGISSEVGLPGSVMKVRFQPIVDAQWRIATLTRPVRGPGQLLAELRTLPEEDIVEVFQLATDDANDEPYKTFYQLWAKHHELGYSLGAFVLALAFTTEKLR